MKFARIVNIGGGPANLVSASGQIQKTELRKRKRAVIGD
jgi:hypothetical protein